MRAAAEGKAIKIFESNLGTITFSVFDAWFVDREIKGQQCPGLFKLKQNKQNEMKKSKEFFEKILELENSNPQIKLAAQKRLQRDFSV